MVEDGVAKTAFYTCYGLYKWMVLPRGLSNAPATFMRAINKLFANLLDHGIIMFLNNVPFYSHNRDEHVQLLHTVFDK